MHVGFIGLMLSWNCEDLSVQIFRFKLKTNVWHTHDLTHHFTGQLKMVVNTQLCM